MEKVTDAFIDFVRHNPRGLSGVKLGLAKVVIKDLLEDGFPVGDLFIRSLQSVHAQELLIALFEKVRGNPVMRTSLLDGVIHTPEKFWESSLDPDAASAMFDEAEDFGYLYANHREMLREQRYNPFLSGLSTDKFWLKRVSWYIAKRDYLRAWDELKKAWWGIYVGEEEFFDITYDSYDRQYNAKAEIVQTLVGKFHKALSDDDVLKELTGLDEAKKMLAEERREHRPGKIPIVSSAGLDLAGKFSPAEQDMVLKIDVFIQRLRTQKRNKKYEKRVAELVRT